MEFPGHGSDAGGYGNDFLARKVRRVEYPSVALGIFGHRLPASGQFDQWVFGGSVGRKREESPVVSTSAISGKVS